VHKRTRGNPFGVTSLPVALSVMRNDTSCTATIVVVQNVPVVHAHAITSVTYRIIRFLPIEPLV
jgi:hypothetical protein